MFSFMRKDKEKEKEKKEKLEKKKREKDEKQEKKERVKKERQNMTTEEISRLEEMKKGLLRRFSDKEKKRWSYKMSHSASLPEHESAGENTVPSSFSKEANSQTKPQPLPGQQVSSSSTKKVLPIPAVKSILKGKSEVQQDLETANLDDSTLLRQNTRWNKEMLVKQSLVTVAESVQQVEAVAKPAAIEKQSLVQTQGVGTTSVVQSFTTDTQSVPNDDDVNEEDSNQSNLQLPAIIPPKPPRIREVKVRRMHSGGFGFSLRKGVIPQQGGGPPKVVTFAEPGSGPHSIRTGLLPGDKLIEVNGQNVETKSREDVAEIIKLSSDSLTLKVQPIQELIELSVRPNRDGTSTDLPEDAARTGTLRRTGSLRHKPLALSEDDMKSAKEWLETEKVWLMHRGGFSEAYLLKSENTVLPEGRVRVKLESGDVIEVDEDDVEKANPPQFDKAEDLAVLRYLNESSALHTLRQRYAANLTHTYAGRYLIVINPIQHLPVYSDKIIQMLKGCKQEDMPPHIYSKAQVVYRDMLKSRQDQSLLLMGRSGSGKTVNAQHVLYYLIMAAGCSTGALTVEKLNSLYTIFSAFGNSRTSLNGNASRFTEVFTVDFDPTGQIGSASIQALMLERTRVVRRPENEHTFNIFYQLLAGADSSLRNDFQIHNLNEANLFMTPLQKPEDKERAVESWLQLQQAFGNLNITESEVKSILSVLAAIYHLGTAGAVKGNSNKAQFGKPSAAQRAAFLLGTSLEELSRSIFSSGGATTLSRTATLRISSAMDRPAYLPSDASATAQECLEGFVIGLYADVFNAVVSLINRAMSSSVRTINSITVVDCPGFQSSGAGVTSSSSRSHGATFEDLCHNYTQERLQAFFHEVALSTPQDLYEEENIILDFDIMPSSPSSIVNLLDKPPQQGLMRSSTADLKSVEKKGLLWILDEEAMFPGATEDSFMERLLQQHCEHPVRKDSLLRKGSLGHTFVLNHNLGMTPILYNAQGWLKCCRENPISRNASLVLQDSKKASVSQLFSSTKGQSSGVVTGSGVGLEGSASLRRVSSMRRASNSGQAGLKKKSVSLQVKFSVDTIMDILKKTSVHFVHCVLPHHFAGLGEQQKPPQDDCILNVPLVRNQLRGFEVLDALRLYRLGFPDSLPFTDFLNKFEPLVPGLSKGGHGEGDQKLTVNMIIEHLDIDKLNYRIGSSRVFFRPGCLAQLEVNRDEKFTGIVEQFQALCRGYLGRKKLQKLKVQYTAIRCIQRNVRKYAQTREWEWWRLYTKVKPILNVHRTEEELLEREAEVESLKAKNEKLEKERTEYKTQCDKLENRLAEVSAELAEENTTSVEAADLLEAETAERMRLDKELRELQNKFTVLKRQHEKLQMEMMQNQLWQAESVDDALEEKEDDSVYKRRYEQVAKELQITKKQLQQQHMEEMDQELQSRKQIERKLHDAVAEAEEQRRQVQVAKKKAQRLTAEMQDLKLHLEEQMSRNNELERKQRRFDSELNMAHEDVREEKAIREKLQKERDELLSEKYSMEHSLQYMKMEQQSFVEKCERLEKDINDLLQTGKDNNEAIALKRSKHELEMKIQDQEEELDDQAGQIQQLEQAKLRLEMNIEKNKQQHQKELEEKDEEIEEMRYKTQKKLRQLEEQLQEEYEQKKRIQEERVQLERQLHAASSRKPQRDRESEKRLRRNLRKTKALLHDAGAALMKQKDIEGMKAQVSTLRNQLDDAEFSSAAAVKAKKRIELEVQELQQQLDDLTRAKQEAESKSMLLLREKTDIQSRLEEVEDDYNEVMKKYKAAVQQDERVRLTLHNSPSLKSNSRASHIVNSTDDNMVLIGNDEQTTFQTVDKITLTDQMIQIEELAQERDRFKQEVSDLQTQVQSYDDTMVDRHKLERLEAKIRDLESRLELETTTKHRLENQVSRHKEQIERLTTEKEDLNLARLSAEEANKRVQKQLRDLREEFGEVQKRELEASQKRKELESRVDELEMEQEQHQSDLKLALKRITDLQAALEEDVDSDSDVLISDSDDGGSSDGSGLNTYLISRKAGNNRHSALVINSHAARLHESSEA